MEFNSFLESTYNFSFLLNSQSVITASCLSVSLSLYFIIVTPPLSKIPLLPLFRLNQELSLTLVDSLIRSKSCSATATLSLLGSTFPPYIHLQCLHSQLSIKSNYTNVQPAFVLFKTNKHVVEGVKYSSSLREKEHFSPVIV